MPASSTTHSEVVTALLSRPPHWLLRSGTGMIALGFGLLIVFAAFIRYPDVVSGEARITSQFPPVPIQGANGQIQVLDVTEGDTVKADQVLAILSQDLPYADVLSLKNWVTEAVTALAQGNTPADPPRPLHPLGVLQAPYSALLAAWDARRLHLSHNLSAQDKAAARQRLTLLAQRSERLVSQDAMLREKLRIATERYEMDSLLWVKNSASWFEVQDSREAMLSAQDNYAQAQAQVLDRDLLAAATLQDIARLGLEQSRSSNDLDGNLWRNLDALRAAIGQWEDKHLLRAPFPGTVTFDLPPAIGQQLAAGQTFGWLVPLQAGPRFARVRIPASGAGKVEKGQSVLISLADYPRAEFGTLSGEVAHVAPLPIEGQYHVDVLLPEALRSSLGMNLALRSETIGQAEIVTRQRSLLSRFLGAVMDALR
ncbi:MAG TPA: HlyD family efflux transporter periplasmic adaptor subunit [Bacteroidia bacterium]|nr:HlyD family efflux transporter periplasmic adaptor subunit [Bacteroidia bacterium]